MENLEAKNFPEPKETSENFRDKLVSIFKMGEKEAAALRERVIKNNGLIRVFIHPYFTEYGESQERDRQEGRDSFPDSIDLKGAELAFKRILSLKPEKTPPILVFIGAASIDDFLDQYKDTITDKLYIIPTREYSPTPLTPEFYPKNPSKDPFAELDLSEEYKDKREEIGWQETAKRLKKLGVKKIIIGGAELYLGEKKEGPHYGCLGNSVDHFSKEFEVDVSGLSWPEGRKEITRLKQ